MGSTGGYAGVGTLAGAEDAAQEEAKDESDEEGGSAGGQGDHHYLVPTHQGRNTNLRRLARYN